MNYRDAVAFLLEFADFERARESPRQANAFALDRIHSLLDRLGRPQSGRPTVHIAGSKGKGSTAAMIEAMLRAAGRRTGLYTSPHLYEFTERIRINGVPLAPADFAALVERLQPVIDQELRETPGRLSTFEILTAMAFVAFRDAQVEAQVIEVGLGGRLDSTNVFAEKAAAVITALSSEHVDVLGAELTGIAGEKAGIMTAGTQIAVLGPQRSSEAAAVVRRRADLVGAPLVEVAAAYAWSAAGLERHGQWFRLVRHAPRPGGAAEALFLTPLLGLHQIENAATAVATIDALRAQGLPVEPAAVLKGLATVEWPGRLEILAREPWLVVDAAHNEESFMRVLESLQLYFPYERLIGVLGTLRDKDVAGMARRLREHAAAVVVTAPDHPRAYPAERLAEAFRDWSGEMQVEPALPAAIDLARSLAGRNDLICVMGSLFVAAAARAHVLRLAGGEPTSARAER